MWSGKMTIFETEKRIFKNMFSWITIFAVFLLAFTTSPALAELTLESVYPNQGVLGQDLAVTLKGTGFDENTRVSMTLDVVNKKAIIGSVDTPGIAMGVTVVGSTAYVADGSSLQVINISSPESPQIIGSVDTPGYAEAVTVVSNTAYVAVGSSGLQVIDISNPASPQIIGSVDTPGYAEAVTVVDSIAYVANSFSLQVIDISTPASPQIIGSVDTPGVAEGVTIVGNTAYMAGGSSGLQVIDISSPASPQIIGSVDTPGYAYGVTVIDNTAYVSNGYSDLQVIDISNSASPQIIGSVDTPGYARGVTVVGDTAYVADWDSGLQIIDISNPASPQIIGSVDTPGYARGVTVVGSIAHVADDKSGLQVIDISTPASPQIIGSVDTPDLAWDVTVVGDTAYVAYGGTGSGLQVVDISNSASPQIIGSVDTPGSAHGVTVVDSIAYVADWGSGLQIIDISTPVSPQIIGSADTPSLARDVTVNGNTAYVTCGGYQWSGLQVINISNPASPQIIGSVDTPGLANGVIIAGSIAYVADLDSGLQVIDISNPASPQIIGSVDTPGYAEAVTVVDSIAYVADEHSGLQVIDISSPASPQIIGHVDTPGKALGVTVVDSIAYVADWDSGLQIIDISNPASPQIIGSVDTPGYARGVTVVGSIAHVADDKSGLVIVPLPVEIKPVTLNSETNISVTLPSPDMAGNYTLLAFNGEESFELAGAVNFSKLNFGNIDPNKLLIQTDGGEEVSQSMDQGEKVILHLIYTSGDGIPFNLSNLSDQVNIQWQTSNSDILSVNSLGIVTAKSAGSAVITAKIPGGSAEVTIEVNGTVQEYEKDYGNLIILSGRLKESDEDEGLSNFCKMMAKEIYGGFFYANFKHDDIYYLSSYGPQAFYGQEIVDEELEFYDSTAVQSVQEAITVWAKNQSNSGPLYIYLVDHGANQQFLINPSSKLSVSAIDASLDEFQQTGRSVVLVIEACHSGTWVTETLQAENRIIISSTNQLAEKLPPFTTTPSFSKYFFDQFLNGKTLQYSFDTAGASIKGAYNYQEPQNYIGSSDLWSEYILDSSFFAEFSVFTAYTGMGESNIQIGKAESLELETTLDVINSEDIEVYAVITPPDPGEAVSSDEFETPVLQQVKVDMTYQEQTEEKGYFGGDKIFTGQSPVLNESGTYGLTFFMKDSTGELISTDPVTFQVGDGQSGLNLTSGWNLLSLNLSPDDSSVEVVLSEIVDNIASVWKWDDGEWAVNLPSFSLSQFIDYVNSKGFSMLADLEPGEGFWVNSNKAQTLNVTGTQPADTSCSLTSGWNLIGLKSNETKLITTFISENEANIASVWKWQDGGWAVYLPGEEDGGAAYAQSKGFSLLSDIEPGEGFWVNCTQAVVLP
jgi:hypothetical protein